MNNAFDYYFSGNFSKAQACLEEIKENFLSDQRNLDKIESINEYLQEIYLKMGKDHLRHKNIGLALQSFEKLKNLLESKSDFKLLSEVFENLADIHKSLFHEMKRKNRYLDAIYHAQRQKEYLKKTGRSIEEVNRELCEMFLYVGKFYYNKSKLRLASEYFEKLKEIYIETDNTLELMKLYAGLGELYFEQSEIRLAVQYFNKLKDLAEAKEDYMQKMYAFEHIGICYQIVRDYKSALNNFKMLLQLAWRLKNIEKELIAYDYISIQYFYMGDLEGAKYYHNRIWKGITEKFTSPTREISNKALEASKNRDKIPIPKPFEKPATRIDGFNLEVPEVNIGLPSPRTSSGESDMQLLPAELKKQPKRMNHSNSKSRVGLIRSRSSLKPPSSLNTTLEIKKFSDTSKRIKPFILLSHLSPMESVKNFLYADQIK
jgi:tetratricopeptide (TPR) repeat protein